MSVNFSAMTQEQIDEFLNASRHAIFATNRIDGPPQLSPVWYLYEDGGLYVNVDRDSAKYHSLRRDSRISICIDGGHPDARAITIYGTAKLIEENTTWRTDKFFSIFRRYVESDEEASGYIEQWNLETDGVLVVVTPTKILARDYN